MANNTPKASLEKDSSPPTGVIGRPLPETSTVAIAQVYSKPTDPEANSLLTIAPEIRNQIYEYSLLQPELSALRKQFMQVELNIQCYPARVIYRASNEELQIVGPSIIETVKIARLRQLVGKMDLDILKTGIGCLFKIPDLEWHDRPRMVRQTSNGTADLEWHGRPRMAQQGTGWSRGPSHVSV
ncbi:hypothetical protein EJ02DRAFT_420255 [Clathrospora elynae]|uniref:Uncharacterized protein n=1 Tax=Clathrospora elynae TaxID=706981 RepID=A0A6A5T6K2_9PLEO|nr:hypothetical protein EJ02DRAFT_420255 [Clathrospora elynae]